MTGRTSSKLVVGTQIASLFAGMGFKFEAKEWRGYPVRPITFDESEE